MSKLTDFFLEAGELAKKYDHPVVSMDHMCTVLLNYKSIDEFMVNYGIDTTELRFHMNEWVSNLSFPKFSDAVQEGIADALNADIKVPLAPIVSRMFFELNKKSVMEQLMYASDEIPCYFMLFECLTFAATALNHALELAGVNPVHMSKALQQYVTETYGEKYQLAAPMTDTSDDYEDFEMGMDEPQSDKSKSQRGSTRKSGESVLQKYTVDLTEQARSGKLSPLIGREKEVSDMVQILSRKNKRNAALVGDAGVGKTQIVDGLALRIASGDVPESLSQCRIVSLNMAALTAGTKFRGDFEERVDNLIKEVSADPNIILFIDEMHTIMSAGSSSSNSMDFSNIIKPVLSRGEMRVIGTTTYAEYNSFIEKDSAMGRRFTKIDVLEPSIEETKKILKGVQKGYEKFHNVKVSTEAFNAIIEYSQKYLQNKKFPDKAIDLMDASCARTKILRSDGIVQADDIAFEVSRTANVPLEIVLCQESDRMHDLESVLKKRVFGQDEAVESLVENVMVARAGLRDRNSVQGTFMFVGPSGTGKTELSKALSDALGVKLIRFDMSEYAQEHTVSKLIGSPPGYVGHDSGNGKLLDEVEQHPNCVLLLDEIEKANRKVLLTFLQVMDEGRLTGSHGKTVYFNNVTIIMTTNLGARDSEVLSLGMTSTGADGMDRAVRDFLPPEFINRIDKTVKFKELSESVIMSVIDKNITELNKSLKPKGVKVKIDSHVKKWLLKHGVTAGMGARPMKRVIEQHMRVALAKEILFGFLKEGGEAKFIIENDKPTLVKPAVQE